MRNKLLSMLLAVLLLFSSVLLASCEYSRGAGGEKSSETVGALRETSDTSEPLEEYFTYIGCGGTEYPGRWYDIEEDEYDYGGHEFKFLNAQSSYNMYVHVDPDMTGDILDDSCFERNYQAEELFNITITEETQYNYNLAEYAKTLIYAEEDVYDSMYIPADDVTPLVFENLFYDLLEIDELHIDRDWWHQSFIERNTINDKLFFTTSDLNLMAFESTPVMYFNEDMMKSLGLEMPYDLALDGEWTWEKFTQYCASAASLNGADSFEFEHFGEAIYGMMGSGDAMSMAYGLGLEMATRNESGRYRFTADTDSRFLSGWEDLIDFYGAENGLYVVVQSRYSPWRFTEGRSLFLNESLNNVDVLRYEEMRFGILPMPKYDEDQENYNSPISSKCLAFCIPTTNVNLERTGRIVDYLTYRSYASILPRYYDIHASLSADGRMESKDVLKMVRGTLGLDASVSFGWTNDLYNELNTLAKEGNPSGLTDTLAENKEKYVSDINNTCRTHPFFP